MSKPHVISFQVVRGALVACGFKVGKIRSRSGAGTLPEEIVVAIHDYNGQESLWDISPNQFEQAMKNCFAADIRFLSSKWEAPVWYAALLLTTPPDDAIDLELPSPVMVTSGEVITYHEN